MHRIKEGADVIMSGSPGMSAIEAGGVPSSYDSKGDAISIDLEGSSPSHTRVARAPSFFPRSAGGTGEDWAPPGRGRSGSVSYQTTQPADAPVVLVWKDLTVKTKTPTPKVLLNNISGQITGGFWASTFS